MRNAKAVWSVLWGLAGIAVLAAGGVVSRIQDEVGPISYGSVPVALVASIIGLSLARRARFDFQRSLGRIGGARIASLGKALSLVAFLLAVAGVLAIVVFAVLKIVD